MVKIRDFLSLIISVAVVSEAAAPAVAQDTGSSTSNQSQQAELDPLDPFDLQGSEALMPSGNDDEKSAQELLAEAQALLTNERLIDARTKLLKALKKDPEEFQTYFLLAGYYMVHVGHYRLALKYIRRAQELFEKHNGPPPYSSFLLQSQHGAILYYLSQIRLNLDDYQGALEALDRFTSYGYFADWYPGSRAWILMKLGKVKEAIQVARMGILAGAEPGRTLNMLGILLSMNEQPKESLEVFRQAIATEMALGSQGQPATPLNNAGEVYKELFDDEKAESTFLRATSLPDGCEHVLPSLNLALLYIDQLKFDAAAATMDRFQQCVAQYPLRNGEEHIALVSLARGRIDMHTGHIDRAIRRFESTLEGTQWFGKIGTNQNDLEVGATISLAQALDRKNHILETYRPVTWREWATMQQEKVANTIHKWWLLRRARQMLVEDLNNIEDLTIRNTDSLIEYPTFGEVLAGFAHSSLTERLALQRQHDKRPVAAVFYTAYEAEDSLGLLYRSRGIELLDEVIERSRPKADDLLKTHATLRRMKFLDTASARYHDLAYRVFYMAPAELRNYGFRLPVKLDGDQARTLRSTITSGPFLESTENANLCTLEASSVDSKYKLRFSCPGNSTKTRLVQDADPNVAVNKLANGLFTEDISNGGNS